MPDHQSPKALADRFAEFFISKISKIRQTFPSDSSKQDSPDKKPATNLNSFSQVSINDLKKIITSSPTKSCTLDPWPTFLVKAFIDILIVPIHKIVNLSLHEGIFPDDFKCAIVTPLHKKPTLPKDELNNYRHVSGLNFIFKTIERVVASQLNNHISNNNLANKYQSAYKPDHSTETALLKLKNDIQLNMAEGKPTAVILLDLSAAFDTIDQTSLIDRLSSWFGVTGNALKWFSSYLFNRCQSVKIGQSSSNKSDLECGVPQGSVLGPILFSLYTAPLSKIISAFTAIKHLLYADDTQVYISLTPATARNTISELQQCLSSVQSWMACNKLKLNPAKIEFIVFGTDSQHAELASFFPTDILGNHLMPSPKVRNLGVIFDACLTFHDHISSIIKSCSYHIKDLRRIRRHLSKSTATTLAIALVSSKLDYCNSLFYNLTTAETRRLHIIQNTLCRIITRTSRYSSITGPLKSLHWLPVKYGIQFKINLQTYKTLHTRNPSYLKLHLTPYTCSHNTRRSKPDKLTLNVPYFNYKLHKSFTQLSSSYSYSAPRLWNSLPLRLRSAPSIGTFCRHLKDHLWDLAYKV